MAALAPWRQLARHADLTAGVSSTISSSLDADAGTGEDGGSTPAAAGSGAPPTTAGCATGERLARATRAMRLGDWVTAARILGQEAEEQPGSWLALDLRAACWLQQGQHERALDDALQCTKLRPEWARGWARLGAAHLCLGHARAAMSAYRQGLQLDPGSREMKLGRELSVAALLAQGDRRKTMRH